MAISGMTVFMAISRKAFSTWIIYAQPQPEAVMAITWKT
jgi:hypothetical protein